MFRKVLPCGGVLVGVSQNRYHTNAMRANPTKREILENENPRKKNGKTGGQSRRRSS